MAKPDDDKKTTITLDAVPEHPMAPAIHTEELWDGPRFVRNAEEKPVWVETKTQYWDLIAKNNFRMADQAESHVKSDVQPVAPEMPVEFTPPPVQAPMTQGEAHLFAAASAVFNGRDLIVVFSCNACFVRKRFHWCEVTMKPTRVAMKCHCGEFGYTPPVGTTDLFMAKLKNIALRSEMPTTGSIITPQGERMLPTAILTNEEAAIIKAFAKTLQQRDLVVHPFCKTCFAGDPTDETNEMAMMISPNDIGLFCQCRQLFHRQHRVTATVH
jgi:hypothetical protein